MGTLVGDQYVQHMLPYNTIQYNKSLLSLSRNLFTVVPYGTGIGLYAFLCPFFFIIFKI